MNIRIRNETLDDVEKIHRVTELAFRDAPHTDHTEQFIVKALRQSGALVVSLVAESGGEIVGHLAISPVSISGCSAKWYGLGPVSVLPEHHGKGIGSQLIRNSLFDIKKKGAEGCVVLGDPDYYGRFGFKAIESLVFPGVPAEYFQALCFGNTCPQGEVAYHEGFSAQA